MKIKKPVSFILGIILILFGLFLIVATGKFTGLLPAIIGSSLIYIGLKPGRNSTLIFGHLLVVTGCILITWGIYLLPHSKPIIEHIFFRPLFWGLFSIFGGICAIFHGFCRCIQRVENLNSPD